MALTGQLSDMSLAELIEFFCNQRKTGRLKIDYQRGHSVFFIKDGELVDAKVGALSGVDAVYFSLTLPNAAFDFSPDVQATRRTISESWTQVVLEGLRRLDEGLAPTEADAFGNFSPTDAEMVSMFDQVERLGDIAQKETAERRAATAETAAAAEPEAAPLSMMVEAAGGERGGRKKWMALGVAAAVVLVCAVAAIPLSGAFGSKGAGEPAPAAAEAPAPAPAAPAPAAPVEPAAEPGATTDATAEAPAAEAEAAESARRERERRERREREERERKAEGRAQNSEAGEAVVPKPAPSPAAGPKSVRVTVSYDEQGRVTQASVAGASPGAEGYGSTAVRIARGRRFPAGKAGSTVVTIPVN
jgi:TonB family protein